MSQQRDSDTISTISTASTLVPPSSSPAPQPAAAAAAAATRTTLTGNPITYKHDNLSNMESGMGCSRVGANTLPLGYTDSSLVYIPVETGEYIPATASGASEPPSEIKREKPGKGVWNRISKRVSGGHDGGKNDDVGLKVVAMSRGDYLKYWAKGEDGKFKAGVVEPEEGRAEWLARALERQEREGLGKVAPRRTQGTEGSAGAFAAAGVLIGGASL